MRRGRPVAGTVPWASRLCAVGRGVRFGQERRSRGRPQSRAPPCGRTASTPAPRRPPGNPARRSAAWTSSRSAGVNAGAFTRRSGATTDEPGRRARKSDRRWSGNRSPPWSGGGRSREGAVRAQLVNCRPSVGSWAHRRTRCASEARGNPDYRLRHRLPSVSVTSTRDNATLGGLMRRIVLLMGLMAAVVGCGSGASDTNRGVRSDSTAVLLSDVQAQQAVYATPCPSGPNVNQGTCVSCVAHALNNLLAAFQIDAAQRDRLQSWFAEAGCACKPTTCASAGKNCGDIPDGCTGGDVLCGTCGGYDTCGGGGAPNVCGCTPTTCPVSANCGSIPNGCGGTVVCGGSCTPPQTCGGGGTPNVCGCTSKTCADLGRTCGSVSDGCGGTLTCGPDCGGSNQSCDCNDGTEASACVPDYCYSKGSPWCDKLCGPTNWSSGNGQFCTEHTCQP